MSVDLNHSNLHFVILKHILDKGFAPRIDQLAQHFDRSSEDIRAALRALQEYHGVVLHPHNDEIWVIHPFSMAPTNFLLRKGNMEWWGNCAWCSLGAAVLLGGEVTITTSLGANREQVRLRLLDGQLLDKRYFVHFPVPMTDAWDNVIFTCSTMLLFEDEAQIDDWSQRHNIPKGDIQPAEIVSEFAKVWYGNHLNPEWQKWTLGEAKGIFDRFNLNHPVWHIPLSRGRF